MFDKEQAKDVFLRYAEAYDTQNILISHKIEHTFRVATLSERYAKALGMCAEDTALAWFLGLLHDIGRFEQVRRFGTFVDSQSVDHAELSGDILFRDGLLDRFPEEGLPEAWKETAEISIRQHNKLRPGNVHGIRRGHAKRRRDPKNNDGALYHLAQEHGEQAVKQQDSGKASLCNMGNPRGETGAKAGSAKTGSNHTHGSDHDNGTV